MLRKRGTHAKHYMEHNRVSAFESYWYSEAVPKCEEEFITVFKEQCLGKYK